MPSTHLLTSQRNFLFEALLHWGFDPGDFSWEERQWDLVEVADSVPALVHQPSNFFFAVGMTSDESLQKQIAGKSCGLRPVSLRRRPTPDALNEEPFADDERRRLEAKLDEIAVKRALQRLNRRQWLRVAIGSTFTMAIRLNFSRAGP